MHIVGFREISEFSFNLTSCSQETSLTIYMREGGKGLRLPGVSCIGETPLTFMGGKVGRAKDCMGVSWAGETPLGVSCMGETPWA